MAFDFRNWVANSIGQQYGQNAQSASSGPYAQPQRTAVPVGVREDELSVDERARVLAAGGSIGWDGRVNPNGTLSANGSQLAPDTDVEDVWGEYPEVEDFSDFPDPEAAGASDYVDFPVEAHARVAASAQPQPQAAPVVESAEPEFRRTITPQGAQSRDARDIDPELAQFNQGLYDLVNGGASREQIYAYLDANPKFQVTAGDLEPALAYRDQNPDAEIPVFVNDRETNLPDPDGVHSALMGVADGVTIAAADEIDAAIDATINSAGNLVGMGDGKSWSERYDERVDDNRRLLRGADEYDPLATNVGRVAGAIATPIKPVGWVSGAGKVRNAARLSAEGTAYGAGYGFNSGDTMDERIQGAQDGAVMGAITGVVTSPVAGAVGRIQSNRLKHGGEGAQVIPAADRLNQSTGSDIKPLAGHVSHGGIASLGTAQLRPTILGGNASGLQKAASNFESGIEDAADSVSRRVSAGANAEDRIHGFKHKRGTPLEDAVAQARNPERVGGLGSFEAEMQARSIANYNLAAQEAGDAAIRTPRTINKIDEILAEWRQVPNGVAGARELEELREELANGLVNGTHTVQGLRNLRTTFGDRIDSGNRTLRRVAKELWPTLSKDITHGLHQQGKSAAAKAYRQADLDYAKDVAALQIVDDLLGAGARNDSAVGTMNRVLNMARNDADRLAHVLDRLDRDVAASLRGGIIDSLGRASASRTTEAGQFSLESFATNWAKMGDTAKKAMFDESTIRDLNDIALLSRSARSVNEMGNPSRSAIFLENMRQGGALVTAGHLVLTGGAAVTGNLGAAAVTLLGLPMTGRVLASPRVARALAKFSKSGDANRLSKEITTAIGRAKANRQQPLLADLTSLHEQVVRLNVEEGFGDFPEADVAEGGEEPVIDTGEDWSDFPEVE